MNAQQEARTRLIGLMFGGFPSAQAGITKATVAAYLIAVEGCSDEAVEAACMGFLRRAHANVDYAHAPSAPDLYAVARAIDDRIARADEEPELLVPYRIGHDTPPGMVPLGPLSVDFGHGRVNLKGLTHAEKEAVLASDTRSNLPIKRTA